MANSRQNAMEYVKDRLERGEITAAEGNVLMVQIEGVRVIRGRVPTGVRAALNDAVKRGELGHLKKAGLKPEIYHNKNAKELALETQSREAVEKIEIIKKFVV